MKNKFVILGLWILAIYCLKEFDLLSLDMNDLTEFISGHAKYAMLLFLALWAARLLFFIPGVTLMFLGGICFDPIISILLSMGGLFLSETLVYIFSRRFASKKTIQFLERKYPDLKTLLEAYNYKFLALGMICPVAPTDVICFLSAAVGLKYKAYIITVLISNIPLLILSSFVVINFSESFAGIALIIVSFIFVTILTVRIWNSMKRNFS
ncbi:TVP38/TMEM64 family protein [Bacillus sp. ISL-51]|uniref:TVP38/TMEM64 family protein n=1 Tax=Pseudomonas sp. ISL-88 TaxID=2819169 RepID=UPI001BE7F7DC|nr:MULTISPECIES: VTT domain-containing protein [Bacteria]MBT2573117.1 TVP38/TMEM64 family protein [Bacillus sp. ISL-51]MBT2712064.1 TVP38/TMEM64 family protein [Pseudomonas sp. ISL-88]